MSTRFAARGVRGANVRARALAQRIVAAAGDNGPDAVNKDAKRRQLEMTPKGDDTPEQILRVSRGTSFEGLKSARRVALDNANAPDFDGDAEQRIGKINWAFDALIEESRAVFAKAVESSRTTRRPGTGSVTSTRRSRSSKRRRRVTAKPSN